MPSGASTGIYEALELRDGDKSRYKGKGPLDRAHMHDSHRTILKYQNTATNKRLTAAPEFQQEAGSNCLHGSPLGLIYFDLLPPPGVLKAVGHINDTLAPALIASVSRGYRAKMLCLIHTAFIYCYWLIWCFCVTIINHIIISIIDSLTI